MSYTTENSGQYSAADLAKIISKCAECGVEAIKLGSIEISFTPTFDRYSPPPSTKTWESKTKQESVNSDSNPDFSYNANEPSMDDLALMNPVEWDRLASSDGSDQ
jgi:hypothetical protein